MICSYCEYKDDDVLLEMVKEKLKILLTTHLDNPVMIMQEMESFLTDRKINTSFNAFINEMSEKDDTWKLWANYVFRDCYAYVYMFTYCHPWQ